VTRAMHVLVVNQYFHPDRSATAHLLTELCEDLAKYHRVTVVCGRPSYDPVDHTPARGFVGRERLGDVAIRRTWSTSFSRTGMPGRLTNYGTYLAGSIAALLSAAKPDVILTMTDPPIVAAAAAAAGAAWRVPFVYVNQDVFPEFGVILGRLSNPAGVQGLAALNRWLRDRAARVVAIGRDMERRLLELGCPPDKLVVIPNWASAEAIRPLTRPSALREREEWDGRFVVMYSGNVGLSQDLETLVEAAALLRDEPSIVFAIVGEGASKRRLREQAAALGLLNVRFLPYQDRDDLSDSLGAADLHVVGLKRGLAGFVVPSKLYGILAAGRPFIAAVEPGAEPATVAEDHDCGVRVEPGDPRALADAIASLRDRDLSMMGANARRALETRFERRVATAAHRRVLEEVVFEHHPLR